VGSRWWKKDIAEAEMVVVEGEGGKAMRDGVLGGEAGGGTSGGETSPARFFEDFLLKKRSSRRGSEDAEEWKGKRGNGERIRGRLKETRPLLRRPQVSQ